MQTLCSESWMYVLVRPNLTVYRQSKTHRDHTHFAAMLLLNRHHRYIARSVVQIAHARPSGLVLSKVHAAQLQLPTMPGIMAIVSYSIRRIIRGFFFAVPLQFEQCASASSPSHDSIPHSLQCRPWPSAQPWQKVAPHSHEVMASHESSPQLPQLLPWPCAQPWQKVAPHSHEVTSSHESSPQLPQ